MSSTIGRALLGATATLAMAAGAAQASGSLLEQGLHGLLGEARAEASVGAMPASLAEAGPFGSLGARAEAPAPEAADLTGVLDLVAEADAAGDAEWRCLAEALYHEARGEPLVGQVAVAEVIMNRAESGAYPSSLCGVVRQGTGEKWMCQFSFYCDGLSDEIRDDEAWDQVGRVARVMIDGAPRLLTEGAMFYHTKAVSPYWADAFTETASIGAHLFYRDEAIVLASN